MRRRAVLTLALALALLAPVACRKKSGALDDPAQQNKVSVRLVQLYFESPRMLLAAEPRNVSLPENPAAAMPLVVRELLKGPAVAATLRLFPPDTVLRGAYLLPGGTAIIDLGGKTLTDGWGTGSHQELMAIYSLVQTVGTNFADAQRVRILVNGTPAETLAGHISLARSLTPRADLVEKR